MNNIKNNIRLPNNVKTFSQTKVEPNEKPEILRSLIYYVRSYTADKIFSSDLRNNEVERNEFINQCNKACKLAIKIIQEAKNHVGTVYFTNTNYYGGLQNEEAIRLCHILIGEASPEEIPEYSYLYQYDSAAESLDKLCKHRNTIISDRKLSFWGTCYTAHAEKFRQFIDDSLKHAVNEAVVIAKLEVWVVEAPEGEEQARLTAKSLFLKTYNKKESYLSLKGLTLTGLPIEVFKELSWLEELNLSENQLSEFSKEIFKDLASLKRLNLSKNGISELPEGAFDGLTDLRKLDLSDNQLNEFPKGIFKDLTSLVGLSLARNRISELPEGAFDGLTNLRVLILSENQLIEFPAWKFKDLNSLKELSLAKNRINKLPKGAFDGLTNLRVLSLSENQLIEFPMESLKDLTSLKNLNLSKNRINELPEGALDGLTNLEVLDLSDNRLSEFPAERFKGLITLKGLYLSRNRISDLPEGAFDGLANLRWLNLSGNLLSLLPEGIFNGLTNLRGRSTLELITTHKQWLRGERNIKFYNHTVNNLFHEFSKPWLLGTLNQLLENHGEIIPEDVLRNKYMQTDSISLIQVIRNYVQGAGQHRRINLPPRNDMLVNGQPLTGIAFEVHNFTDGIESVALNAIDEFLKVLKVSKPSFTIGNLRSKFNLIEDAQMRTKANNALNRISGSADYKARLESALPAIAAFLNSNHNTWEQDYQTEEARWSMWLMQSFVEAGTAYTSGTDNTSCVKGIYERIFTGFRGMHPLINCLFIPQTVIKEFNDNIKIWLSNINRADKLIAKLKKQGLTGNEADFESRVTQIYLEDIQEMLAQSIDNSLNNSLDKLTHLNNLSSYLAEVVNGRKEQVISNALEKCEVHLDNLECVDLNKGQSLDDYIKNKLVSQS
jgi:Leucine-rich repeat (LRR) protein